MVGIDVKHFRTLIMEGVLRYKEDTTKVRLTVCDVANVHSKIPCLVGCLRLFVYRHAVDYKSQ